MCATPEGILLSSRDVFRYSACHNTSYPPLFLLLRNGFSRPLRVLALFRVFWPRTGIAAMTNTAIAADFHQALDVQCNFTSQIAFNFCISGLLDDPDVLRRSSPDSFIFRDAGRSQYFLGNTFADAIDVSQRNNYSFISRNVYSCNTCHIYLLVSLTLLMFGLVANDHDIALAFDYFAFVADFFYRWSDFHTIAS